MLKGVAHLSERSNRPVDPPYVSLFAPVLGVICGHDFDGANGRLRKAVLRLVVRPMQYGLVHTASLRQDYVFIKSAPECSLTA